MRRATSALLRTLLLLGLGMTWGSRAFAQPPTTGTLRVTVVDPSGAVAIHKLAYRAYQALALPGGLPESRLDTQAYLTNPYYFAATGEHLAKRSFEARAEQEMTERMGESDLHESVLWGAWNDDGGARIA